MTTIIEGVTTSRTLTLKGLEKPGAAGATTKAPQGRGLTAAQKQVASQCQKLPRSACDKDLERWEGKEV